MEQTSKWKIRRGVFKSKLSTLFIDPILRLRGKDPKDSWFWWCTGGKDDVMESCKTAGSLVLAFLRHPLLVTIVGVLLTGLVTLVVWRLTIGWG
jgi:hypothetical protein